MKVDNTVFAIESRVYSVDHMIIRYTVYRRNLNIRHNISNLRTFDETITSYRTSMSKGVKVDYGRPEALTSFSLTIGALRDVISHAELGQRNNKFLDNTGKPSCAISCTIFTATSTKSIQRNIYIIQMKFRFCHYRYAYV